MFFASRKLKTYRCAHLQSDRPEDALFSRQQLIPGFNHGVFSGLRLGQIGAGGLGSEIAEGLVKKGVGKLWIFDFDEVALSNLNRQLFRKRDISKPKALRLARNLSKMGFGGTVIRGVAMSFQEAVQEGLVEPVDALVCGVDNNETRVYACQYALQQRLPIVFTAVSRDGNNGSVLVQEPGEACYGCIFKGMDWALQDKKRASCPPDPAIKDILKLAGGLVLYAVDSLFMERKRNWNFRELFLAGFVRERLRLARRQEDCLFCGSQQTSTAEQNPERR